MVRVMVEESKGRRGRERVNGKYESVVAVVRNKMLDRVDGKVVGG